METDVYHPECLMNLAMGQLEVVDYLYICILILLLICSGLISSSEVAFFSLTPSQTSDLDNRGLQRVTDLLKRPNRLLATILISNNFVNVGIVILSSYLTSILFDFSMNPTLGFIIQVVVVTFIILLFGEIIPKIYANQAQVRVAVYMAGPLHFLNWFFKPLSTLLIRSTSVINKKISQSNANLSIDQLSKALELTNDSTLNEEKNILEGIVRFSNISSGEIIQPRINVVGVEYDTGFDKVKQMVIENSYSRMPVYKNDLDTIAGILYIKDLLPFLQESDTYKWQNLIRPAYFVPETKKINDLLEEFRAKKVHMCVVVDEYGGTSGIVTMEDILEEIVGEINDEYDEKEENYLITPSGAYIFKASILLNDFMKIVPFDEDKIKEIEADADTLAGLILEIVGALPKKGDIIHYQNYRFTILDADNRKIKKVKYEVENS